MIQQAIAEIVFGIISDYLILNIALDKAKQRKLGREVQSIILEEFDAALKGLPNYESLITDPNFLLYFENETVQREISKFLSPNENPDEAVLFRIWNKCYPLAKNSLLLHVFQNFVLNVEKRILNIPELQQIISYKHNRSDFLGLQTSLKETNELITRGFASSDDFSEDQGANKKYQEVISNSQRLLENNRPNAALDLLLNAEISWASDRLEKRDKAQILNLIGNCYLIVNKINEAEEYYRRATTIDPGNYRYLANHALIKLHLGEFEKAKELARVSQEIKENDVAISVFAEVDAWEQDYSGLDEVVLPKYLDSPIYLFTLGSVFYKGKEFTKATNYLQLYLALQPDDFNANLFLGQVILESIVPEKWTHAYELPIEGNQWKESIGLVIKYTKKALEIISSGDNEYQKIRAKSSLAAAFLIKGDFDKAKIYYDEVLRSKPDHKFALHNRIIISVNKKDYHSALELMKRLPEKYLYDPNFYAIAARVFIGLDQPQKAIELLEKLTVQELDEPNYYIMLAWSNYKLEKPEWYETIKEEILFQSNMSESNKHETLANILITVGRKEEAINELKIGLDYSQQIKEQKRIKLRLADLYFGLGNHEQTAFWFENSNCDLLIDPHIARIYILSIFNMGDYKKAYKLSKKFNDLEFFDPLILEIQGRIAEYLTDFGSAIQVEERFINEKIDTDFHKTQLARLHFRNRDRDKAESILKEVNFDQTKDPFLITQSSQLFLLLDDPEKSIELGLKAYINGHDKSDINLSYLITFLRVDDSIDLEKNKIEPNTAFLIDDGQKQEWLKIVDIYEPNIRINEYSPKSETAQKYLGHKKGDEVILKETDIENLSVKILEIQSIFVRTFQEIADSFSIRFPEIKAFHKIHITRDDPSQFLMAVARLGLHLEQVLSLYNSRLLTIEQIAYLAGKSPIDTLLLLQSNPPYKIFASIGSQQLHQSEFVQLINTKSITLIYTGIFTAANLEFLKLLPEVFENLYVAQKLIDELENELDREMYLREKGGKSIGYSRGRFTFVDIPKEMATKKIELLKEILAFINKYCQKIPIDEEFSHLLSEPDSPEEFFHHLGQLTQASMIIAKQTNSSLYSEESLVREKGREIGINSFWTQSLLDYLKSISMISNIQYSQFITSLIFFNYFTPTLDEDIIYAQIKSDQFHVTREVRILLSGLSGNDINNNYAINVSSSLISKIWFESIPPENKFFMQEAVLIALLNERENKDLLLIKLISSINSLMTLLPQTKKIIAEDLREFRKLAY